MRPRRFFVLVLLCLLAGPSARAQNPASKAAATKLFDEGLALLREEKWSEACPKFKESQRLDPALGTLLYLSECYARRGQTASAWAGFREAADMAQRLSDKRQKAAQARAEELEARLSKLVMLVPLEVRIPGLVIERDGQPVEPVNWELPVPVDPGEHQIKASAPGHKEQIERIQISPGETLVSVRIPRLPRLASATPAVSSAPPESPRGGSTQRTAGYVLGGAGAVGLLGGGWLLWSASRMGDDSRAQRDLSLYHSAQDRQTWGRVALGAGAALVGAGIVLVVLAPRPEGSTSLLLQPIVAQREAGLYARGSW